MLQHVRSSCTESFLRTNAPCHGRNDVLFKYNLAFSTGPTDYKYATAHGAPAALTGPKTNPGGSHNETHDPVAGPTTRPTTLCDPGRGPHLPVGPRWGPAGPQWPPPGSRWRPFGPRSGPFGSFRGPFVPFGPRWQPFGPLVGSFGSPRARLGPVRFTPPGPPLPRERRSTRKTAGFGSKILVLGPLGAQVCT